MDRHTKRLILTTALLCFGAYTGSYLWLSLAGRYEPDTVGLNGVKDYQWTPNGFVNNFRETSFLPKFYSPLLAFDRRCWHTREDAGSDKYPINEVKKEDIWKVYRTALAP